MKRNDSICRRDFLKAGSGLILLPLLGISVDSCTSKQFPWQSMVDQNNHSGNLLIREFDGETLIDGTKAKKNMVVNAGQTLELKSGLLFASLPDGSVLRLSNKATLQVDLDSKQGGLLTLKKGGLLAAIRKSERNPYLIRNTSALVGIKGTVCFTEVLSGEDKNNPKIPTDATDYFCLCNGNIDYLDPNWEFQKSSIGEYHKAYFLKPTSQGIEFKYAGWLLNHSDKEILELIDTMQGEKHDTSWIRDYKEQYE